MAPVTSTAAEEEVEAAADNKKTHRKRFDMAAKVYCFRSNLVAKTELREAKVASKKVQSSVSVPLRLVF